MDQNKKYRISFLAGVAICFVVGAVSLLIEELIPIHILDT